MEQLLPVPEKLVLFATKKKSGNPKILIKGHPSQYVKLNVGGWHFYTTIGTLTKHDTMLSAMFSGRMEVPTDAEGWILIYRSGKHFDTILNFLRDGDLPLPKSPMEIADLLSEAKYYHITELTMLCKRALLSYQHPKPIYRIALITSENEEQVLISSSLKPMVILKVQLQNANLFHVRYSEHNLLKNIKLFDKLSMQCNERILFVKGAIKPSEICCWFFYGHGKKVAEVNCTSTINSGPDAEVLFPEDRIYEETLRMLLYENRNAHDEELLQETSSYDYKSLNCYIPSIYTVAASVLLVFAVHLLRS